MTEVVLSKRSRVVRDVGDSGGRVKRVKLSVPSSDLQFEGQIVILERAQATSNAIAASRAACSWHDLRICGFSDGSGSESYSEIGRFKRAQKRGAHAISYRKARPGEPDDGMLVRYGYYTDPVLDSNLSEGMGVSDLIYHLTAELRELSLLACSSQRRNESVQGQQSPVMTIAKRPVIVDIYTDSHTILKSLAGQMSVYRSEHCDLYREVFRTIKERAFELTFNTPGFLPKLRLNWVPSVHGPNIPQHHAVHIHASMVKEAGKSIVGYGEHEDCPNYTEADIPPKEGVFASELRPVFGKHLGAVTWPQKALRVKSRTNGKGRSRMILKQRTAKPTPQRRNQFRNWRRP